VTQERQPDSTADTAGTTEQEPVVSSGGQTVEEVEAFWRNRQSGIQRAHNAETQSLLAQMEQMRAQPAPAPAGETPEAARVRELETALASEQNARRAESLKAQYPMTAAILGDEFAKLDLKPEKLAAMEAAYDRSEGGGPPIIDPNQAPRVRSGVQTPAAKPLNEKSKDELLADLRSIAPAYQQALQEGEID
jgi:hypothetical protein